MARLYSARIQPPLPLVACFYYARQLKLLASTLDFASTLLISPIVNQTPLLPVLIRNYELQMHRILILIIQPVLPSRELMTRACVYPPPYGLSGARFDPAIMDTMYGFPVTACRHFSLRSSMLAVEMTFSAVDSVGLKV